MNYSELSDFELNKLVAKKLGFEINAYMPECDKVSISILENKINIGTIDGEVWWASLDYNEYGDQYYFESSNPLRAAVTCFLMMEDK